MEEKKIRVLFICVANSFRSQVAMTLLNEKYGDQFVGESAGYKTKPINPLAIKIMKANGYDISANPVSRVIDLYNQGKSYDYVITVCNESEESDCPVFPGSFVKFHWREFVDPETYQGDEASLMEQAQALVDAMIKKIDALVLTVK